MADLSQLEHFSSALSSKIKSVAPVYFVNFGLNNSSSNSRQAIKNFRCGKIIVRMSLIC